MTKPWLLSAFLLTGCTHAASYVRVQNPDAALGRVIVYRNGIAYFERSARVSDEKLTLQVPGDKVNDFLKSLTVVDAKTGQAMPIDFPQPGRADASGNVQMTVRLPAGPHDLRLSYVSEAPAWKPSYRVMVDADGQVRLQGWAIVDNTSGEDWSAVKVGVGSSSALSFRYDLHSIRLIDRETLAPQQLFAQAPPTGGGLHTQSETVVLAQLDEVGDDQGPREEPPAERADAHVVTKRSARGGGAAVASAPPPTPKARPQTSGHSANVANLARTLRAAQAPVTIEGYADAGGDAAQGAIRANQLRDELVRNGVPADKINVVARGVVPGQRGVRIVQASTPATTQTGPAKTSPPADPVGESHFESPVPLSVRRGTSAMVSILNSGTKGEVVYLYDPESARGDTRYAFKAVHFTNPTSSTLEAGPMTVYGKDRFIGEGMTDTIPAKASAVIPFALDRQIVVEQTGSTAERIASLTKAVRGVFSAELKRTRKLGYKITNRLSAPTTVYVKHVVPAGYRLTSAHTSERFGDAHLFRVALAPGQTKLLELEEETPVERTLDLRTGEAMDLLRAYLEMPAGDTSLAESLHKLLKLHQDIGQHEEKIQGLRERASELRVRMDELHAQIFDLQALRTGGTLLAHLKDKMKEISDQVQKNTLAIVEQQEKLTLVKIQLADGLSDLTLEKRAVAAASPAATR
jgi:hypothetical protein